MNTGVPAGSLPGTVHWQPGRLLVAPHRLGFFLAMLVLASAGLWWALVQLDRAGAGLLPAFAVSPTTVHSVVMTFGFIPLFFAGFLFTAGPRWLGVDGPEARVVLPALLLQTAGWWVWIVGGHLHAGLAVVGLVLALVGLTAVTRRFWRLIAASPVADRLHVQVIGVAHAVGCVALAGVALALLADAPAVLRAFVLSALWGFVVVTYVSVAHRMIPFFTSSALPMQKAWRPFWVLWLMLGVAVFEALAVWVETLAAPGAAWTLLRAALELAAGSVLAWLAFAWGLVQSLKLRLLAMLHLGFLWLGLGLMLSGLSQAIGVVGGAPVLPLAALHAVTMGCLASLMLAMVTRVSCGHSGRALVADRWVWALFWLLQLATLLRIGGALQHAGAAAVLLVAALLWALVVGGWALRLGRWYGQPRVDGRPG